LAGVAVGLPSLAYPPSWDMSVHIYVAREWLLRGAMPYRDTFDHKGPGLYALHAIVLVLFGGATWGFRLLELASVSALGVTCAWITAAPRERPERGIVGVSVLAANVFAFGFLDYWNTAQGELECALLATVSVLVARRGRDVGTAAVVVGGLGGAAALVQPKALLPMLVPLAMLVVRARRERRSVGILVRFGGALLALPIVVMTYFACRGALHAAVDVLVFANLHYVTHEHAAHGIRGALHAIALVLRHFGPSAIAITSAALAGMAWARARRRAHSFANHAIALAILATGFASVLLQWKFFLYHWSIAAGGVVLVVANVTVDARRALGSVGRAHLAAPAVAAATWLAFVRTGNEDFALWRDNALLTVRWARGSIDDDAFAARITRAPGKRDFRDIRNLARWIHDHSKEDDYVLVRGEAAEIYVIADRRAPGRFFWSTFLSSPTRAYRRDDWLGEDARAITEHPPRFVVVRRVVASGPDSAAWFAPRGYQTVRSVGAWLILSRAPLRDGVLQARAQ